MKNAATTATKTLKTPLGETLPTELKTGDLIGIIDEEVIEPEGIVEEPDIDIDGEAGGIIIEILVMLDVPDIVLLHPPKIPLPHLSTNLSNQPCQSSPTRNFYTKIINYSTSMIAGPATIVSSVAEELPLVSTT